MATRFKMTDEQRALKADYDKNGWPQMLTRSDIELYMQRQWLTIIKTYGTRPDWPVQKIGDIWTVPLDDWRGFLSAVYTRRYYLGLKSVEYGTEEDLYQ